MRWRSFLKAKKKTKKNLKTNKPTMETGGESGEKVGKAAVSPLTPLGGGDHPQAMQGVKAELRFGYEPHSPHLLSPHCRASCWTPPPTSKRRGGQSPPPTQEGSWGAQGVWVQGEGNGLQAAVQGTVPGCNPRDPSSIREEEKGMELLSPPSLCSQPPEQTGT